MSSELSSILSYFKLREEDCRKIVTSYHLDVISLRYSEYWKFLISQLGLEDNVVGDIDCKPIDEKEKRREFFREWKQRKGSEATYERLLLALLKCEQRQDAENVCKLLYESLQASSTAALVSTCDHTIPLALEGNLYVTVFRKSSSSHYGNIKGAIKVKKCPDLERS